MQHAADGPPTAPVAGLTGLGPSLCGVNPTSTPSPYLTTLRLLNQAYYYMQHRADGPPTAPIPGLTGLGPSFLSLDVAGIVLRLDTFSKLLAPGFRLGWLTAPTRLADAYDR